MKKAKMKNYINLWRESCQIARDFINAPSLAKAFICALFLYAIALFALIRGDIYYYDDWINSVNDGVWNWSRHLSNVILGGIASFGKGTLDSSPLLQIMGVCFVVISSLILLYLIRGKFDLIGIIASLPLGLSPHFLQNLSFKFDSLTMGMALFFAIAPFLFQKNMRVFCAVSVILLLCAFMCYQAANGTYIILSLYFAFSAYFLQNRSFKQSAGFLGICAVNLIIATLIYGLMINDSVMGIGNSYASHEMLPLNLSFFPALAQNLATYATTIFSDLQSTAFIWLVAINCAIFVINIAIHANRPKMLSIFSATAFLALGFALSFGLYLVLQKPLFAPRAFYGFNAFVAIIGIANVSLLQLDSIKSTHSAPPRLQKFIYYASFVVAIIMAYFLISFANIYGNALKKQDEYLDFRARLLLNDFGKVIPHNPNIMINIEAFVNDNHPVAQRFADKYGNISRIIPRTFMATHLLGGYESSRMLGEFCEVAKEQLDNEVVLKNAYHTIKRVKNCYIVTMQ